MYLKKELYELVKSDESIFDFIQEGALDGLWYWDLENPENEWMNRKFWEVLGYNPEEIPDKTSTWQDIINPDDLKRATDNFNRHVADPSIPYDQEVRYTHKNGSTVWIRCRGLVFRNEKGEAIRMLGAHQDITALKQAEEKLRAEKKKLKLKDERYRFITENTSDVILYQSSDGDFNYISPNIEELTGYTPDEYAKLGTIENVFPQDRPILEDAIKKLLDGTEALSIEYRLYHKTGQVNWVQSRIKAIRDENGQVVSLLSSNNDITHQKQLQIELAKSEAKFRTIVENSTPIIFSIDKNGKFILSEGKSLTALGLKPGQVVGMSAFDIYKDFPEIVNGIKIALAGKTHRDTIHVGGAFFDIFYSPNIDSSGCFESVSGMAVDITEQKVNQAKLKNIIESSTNLFYSHSVDGEMTFISPQATEVLGYELDELMKYWTNYITDNPINEKAIEYTRKAIETGKRQPTYELEMQRKDGRKLLVEAREAPVVENGKVVSIVGSLTDITDRKQAESELIIAKEKAEESDRLKSAFLANMSHEIRTPMNGILGFADLLKKPDLTGKEQKEYIEIIERSGKRMLNIINDIIDISKIEAGLMKFVIDETNINEQIEYTYTFFRPEVEAKGIELSYSTPLPAKEANIKTDSEKVYAILTNLVKNAVKYTEKGSIELGYCVKRGKLADELEFYVKDTGIGIPKHRHKAVFERFIQADIEDKMAKQGAGLGLAITKSYVEMLGGKIWVESENGKGSTFYFTLPYNTKSDEGNKAGQHLAPRKDKTVRKIKILIAEDDKISEMLLQETMKLYSNKLLKATTGIEAVQVCRNTPDIDLVLMDIRMPEMDGYKATRQIREFNKEVIIIAQTAYGLPGDREKALENGCNDYIAKPIQQEQLHALVLKYFGNRW
ncbi:PAS domain S-box protein [uncultured Draconibacterium sp.]|uniref:PAS domain S-box protein n=1 Tax=uncultured Draconibacterium sp. TaxID=1573823 RepID=UPI002AA6C410|nr:PAS domain S-box protein [uncultured Draconibacterium sp.]